MIPDQQRREWRKLSMLGWLFTAIVLNSFFGGALLFDFRANYFAQAFDNTPVVHIFDNPDPAQLPLLVPALIVLQGGFTVGALFFWVRTQMLTPLDQVVMRYIVNALAIAAFVLSFVIVGSGIYAEFYSRTDAEFRSFLGLAVTMQFFYVMILSLGEMISGIMLYRAKTVPPILSLIMILFAALAFLLNLLLANPDAPDAVLTGGTSMLSADIMLWSGLLWYWSRPAAADASDTETIGKVN